ncbi:MAG: aminotransferase class V-fold PLP-dependent enzyme [Crocinitomix sp.]|nr:aminotransferase class V-fold PLP-dependent enzyme [Crocinitomix sp.]
MTLSLLKRFRPSSKKLGIAHDDFFNDLIEREYHRIISAGHTYLDFTGGNLYAKSQLDKHYSLLSENVFGNPHSTNPTSKLATELVDESRQKVLDFFNADDYFCVFTQNASAALKIVGECYPFTNKGHFLLLADNHNSVNGIREYAVNKHSTFEYCPIQYEDLRVNTDTLTELLAGKDECEQKLFAFPAQSNVSGVKHDLKWIEKAHDKGWDVLLDAAAFVPTSKLDLSKYKPDFVSVSFYKIFGYPTGIGCLLIKKNKFEKLVKPWFAGGTVTLASVQSQHHYLANNHERYENGTLNYLDIPAIGIGLDYINAIGMDRINERVSGLINHLCNELRQLKHDNGNALVRIFGPTEREDVGGTLIMNFFDKNGDLIPFESIEEEANAEMISIRSGCFCNPGIDEINNCLTTEELAKYFTSRTTGNYYDMIDFLNKMRGATRVSVGIATRSKDLDTFLNFAKQLLNRSTN